MDALNKVFGVIKSVAPTLVRNLVPGSGLVMDIVKAAVKPTLSDGADIEAYSPVELANMAEKNAAIIENIKRIAADKEVALAKEESARIESVNQTMRIEAPGHKWASMWRPYWGFVSGAAFFLVAIGFIGLLFYAVYKSNTDLINATPALIMAISALFSIPGAILGVSAWHRGKMQRINAGEDTSAPGGLVGLVNAFRKGGNQ